MAKKDDKLSNVILDSERWNLEQDERRHTIASINPAICGLAALLLRMLSKEIADTDCKQAVEYLHSVERVDSNAHVAKKRLAEIEHVQKEVTLKVRYAKTKAVGIVGGKKVPPLHLLELLENELSKFTEQGQEKDDLLAELEADREDFEELTRNMTCVAIDLTQSVRNENLTASGIKGILEDLGELDTARKYIGQGRPASSLVFLLTVLLELKQDIKGKDVATARAISSELPKEYLRLHNLLQVAIHRPVSSEVDSDIRKRAEERKNLRTRQQGNKVLLAVQLVEEFAGDAPYAERKALVRDFIGKKYGRESLKYLPGEYK